MREAITPDPHTCVTQQAERMLRVEIVVRPTGNNVCIWMMTSFSELFYF